MRRRLSVRERGGRWRAIRRIATPPVAGAASILAAASVAPLLVAVPVAPLHAQASAVDTTGLGSGPHAHMSMLLERTIFQVDVLTLDLRLGTEAEDRLDRLLGDGEEVSEGEPAAGGRDDTALADSVAAVALDAREVLAVLEFHRDVDLEQFLGGIRENLGRAREAGIVSADSYDSISADLPGWYSFLEDRGIRSDDRMFQRIRGDTLHTVYVTEDGETLLDQVDVGPERRLAVLGGYFAPGSEFREGLVESALDPEPAPRSERAL